MVSPSVRRIWRILTKKLHPHEDPYSLPRLELAYLQFFLLAVFSKCVVIPRLQQNLHFYLPRDLLTPRFRRLPYFLVYAYAVMTEEARRQALQAAVGGAMRRGRVPELRERRLGRSERDSTEL